MPDPILVLSDDYHLAGTVAKVLRYREIYCIPMPLVSKIDSVYQKKPKGLILYTQSAHAAQFEALIHTAKENGLPVLALGGAALFLCEYCGGSCGNAVAENENQSLTFSEHPLFQNVDSGDHMLASVTPLGLSEQMGAIAAASDQIIGFSHLTLPLFGVQYPIERNDPDAAQLLFNFAHIICDCELSWNDVSILARITAGIQNEASDGKVLCAVSGGVDSAVCAALVKRAVGDRLSCVFVDTGLFRKDEADTVKTFLSEALECPITRIQAQDSMMASLRDIVLPAEKESAADAAIRRNLLQFYKANPECKVMAEGTNLDDSHYGFDSPSSQKYTIPKIINPLEGLFKEEIRSLAASLDLPPAICERQPFPASGLALRIHGAITQDRLLLLREADAIFRAEIREYDYERKLKQYSAELMENCDEPGCYSICLCALQAGQAECVTARLPFDLLKRVSELIKEEIPHITRVFYDYTDSTC